MGPLVSLTVVDDAARFERALSELPVLLLEVLVLRDVEGCSYSQIAEITGTSVSTVLSRIVQARSHIMDGVGRNAS